MRQTTKEFTVVGAWRKGITVGNWREGGCAAQSLIHSLILEFITARTQLRLKSWKGPQVSSSVESRELPKSEEKIGGVGTGSSSTNKLRWSMCFSYKIHFEIEPNAKLLRAMHLITYFKYLYFSYLTTLLTNTQNNLGFSCALPAAHAL